MKNIGVTNYIGKSIRITSDEWVGEFTKGCIYKVVPSVTNFPCVVNDNNVLTYDILCYTDDYEVIDDINLDKEQIVVEYINTGKKVKPTCDDWEHLTYNKVYDVFTDGAIEFVFDDVGVKCYQSSAIFEVVDDTVNTDNTIVETNHKFKEGDKVMVVNTDYISAYDAGVRVGDIGTVIESGVDKYHVKFEGTSYDCDWWFTDSCIELVDDNIIENTAIVSDGGSSSYYTQQIPKGMLERFNTTGTIEAKDVIRLFLGNDFNMGNIFKAYCRVISLRNGKGKAGIGEKYDLTKAKFFAEDELNSYLENTDV